MNRNELKEWIIENNYPTGRHTKLLATIEPFLLTHTKFLDRVYDKVPIANRLFCILYDIYDVPVCLHCKQYTTVGTHYEKVNKYQKNGFRKYCCQVCSSKGTRQEIQEKNLEKYGVKHHMHRIEIKEKVANTNIDRYGNKCYIATKEYQEAYKERYKEKTGYDHHFSNPEVISKRETNNELKYGSKNSFQFSKDTIKKTMMDKYGVDNPLKVDSIKEKVFATNTEKYGFKSPMMNPEISEKIKITCQERYGVDNATQRHFSKEFLELINDKEALEKEYILLGSADRIAKKYDIGSHRTVLLNLHKHEIDVSNPSKESTLEYEIREFLDFNSIPYHANDRTIISPKELDIVIPGKQLAIEINGDYHHSDLYKDKFFHQHKVLKSREKGIKLIHMYGHQFFDERLKKIMLEKILYMNGIVSETIYARKCTIAQITNSEAKELVDTHHIQGSRNANLVYGLYHNNELVCVLSLGNKKNNEFEIIRYASKVRVIGGFTKLLSHFKKNNHWTKIWTYASLDYGHGDMYSSAGFEFIKYTDPNYFYVKNNIRYSRQQFMKHKLKDKLEIYDDELTEKQLMDLNGYLRVYDSGSAQYCLSK